MVLALIASAFAQDIIQGPAGALCPVVDEGATYYVLCTMPLDEGAEPLGGASNPVSATITAPIEITGTLTVNQPIASTQFGWLGSAGVSSGLTDIGNATTAIYVQCPASSWCVVDSLRLRVRDATLAVTGSDLLFGAQGAPATGLRLRRQATGGGSYTDLIASTTSNGMLFGWCTPEIAPSYGLALTSYWCTAHGGWMLAAGERLVLDKPNGSGALLSISAIATMRVYALP